MEANREREKRILKGTKNASLSPSHSDDGAHDTIIAEASDAEVCSICFEQACTIEVRECGHQMCAACTLALCCHTKPNPATQSQPLPTCPFCRGGISRLVVATRTRAGDEEEEVSKLESPRHRRSRRSMNLSSDGGSTSSLMGSIASSIGKMGRRRTDSSEQVDDKP
uniref:RING-type E3 ubiquitin transferase n=1 Tax=Arundo donax TaxID=35708 RepID=A0A0A9HF81_ARUDO